MQHSCRETSGRCSRLQPQHMKTLQTPASMAGTARPLESTARTALCTRERLGLNLNAFETMSSKSRTSSCHVAYCRPRTLPRMNCIMETEARGRARQSAAAGNGMVLIPFGTERSSSALDGMTTRGGNFVHDAHAQQPGTFAWQRPAAGTTCSAGPFRRCRAPTSKHMGLRIIL